MSLRPSSFANSASSHSTLPLGKSVQANISRSLMLKGSDSGRYMTGEERSALRAAAHQNQHRCLFLCCFYPIKQETSAIGTFTPFVIMFRKDTGRIEVPDKAAIVMLMPDAKNENEWSRSVSSSYVGHHPRLPPCLQSD